MKAEEPLSTYNIVEESKIVAVYKVVVFFFIQCVETVNSCCCSNHSGTKASESDFHGTSAGSTSEYNPGTQTRRSGSSTDSGVFNCFQAYE